MVTYPAPKPPTFDEMADRAIGVRALADTLMTWVEGSRDRVESWAALAATGLDPAQMRLCAYVGAEELSRRLDGPDGLNVLSTAQRLERVRMVEEVLCAVRDAAAGWRPEAIPTARAQMARDHHAATQGVEHEPPPLRPRPMGAVIQFPNVS